LELAEEGAGIVAEEDVGAKLPGQVVVDLVVDVRPQVSVLVGASAVSWRIPSVRISSPVTPD